MRKRRWKPPGRPPDSTAPANSRSFAQPARGEGVSEPELMQVGASIAAEPALRLQPDLADLLLSRAKKSQSKSATQTPVVLHTLVSAQQMAPAAGPVFVYDRAATTDLLQWCLAQRGNFAVVCFVPAGKNFSWNYLLKGMQLLTQVPKGSVIGFQPDEKQVKATCDLNVWLLAEQPEMPSCMPVCSTAAVVPSTSHTMQVKVHVSGSPTVALIDTGAEAGPYLSEAYVALHGISVSTGPAAASITGVQGSTGNVIGHCVVRLKLGHVQQSVRCTVIPMVDAFDLLLSDTWL